MYSKEITNKTQEFYASLGILSTKYAQMERNIMRMLQKLIGPSHLSGMILIENNSLSKNLDLIKQLNRIHGFEEEYMKRLLSKINGVKGYRNLFIHGIWREPCVVDNDIEIICVDFRIKYLEEKVGNSKRKTWSHGSLTPIRLTMIKKQLQVIDEILISQEALLGKLDAAIEALEITWD